LSIETIYFATLNENVIIPSKSEENAGYDIYAHFPEDSITVFPHETATIPTGLFSMFSSDYYFQIEERGSTGSKGIGKRCGVIDSNYRGEWKIIITNHNTKALCITKDETKVSNDFVIYYPYKKAIAQAVFLPVPKTEIEVMSLEELLSYKTDRGSGAFGSSGK